MRRIWVTVAVMMTMTMQRPATAFMRVDELKDVPQTHWSLPILQKIVDTYRLLRVYPDGTFRGNQALNRYEAADILYSVLLTAFPSPTWYPRTGYKVERTPERRDLSSKIRDVPRDHWAYGALKDVLDRFQVMDGYPDLTFRGNEPITSPQFIRAMHKTMTLIRVAIGIDIAKYAYICRTSLDRKINSSGHSNTDNIANGRSQSISFLSDNIDVDLADKAERTVSRYQAAVYMLQIVEMIGLAYYTPEMKTCP